MQALNRGVTGREHGQQGVPSAARSNALHCENAHVDRRYVLAVCVCVCLCVCVCDCVCVALPPCASNCRLTNSNIESLCTSSILYEWVCLSRWCVYRYMLVHVSTSVCVCTCVYTRICTSVEWHTAISCTWLYSSGIMSNGNRRQCRVSEQAIFALGKVAAQSPHLYL